jgi:hypothetical protein
MGWIKDRNVDVLATEARDAALRGERVFVTVLHSGAVTDAGSGELQVRTEWARRIDAIEANGWRLEHWSISLDGKGNPVGVPVFRRREG